MKRALLAAGFAALVLPAAAGAHATLIRTVPIDGAVLAHAPAEVRVVFDDTVHPGPDNAAIRNGGRSILAGKSHVSGGRTLVLPLRRGLPNGDYTVRWSIVSDDGHLESGVLAFAVGSGQAKPQAALAAAGTGPQAADVIARWLLLAGVLAAVGISLFALATRAESEVLALVPASAAVVAALGAAEESHRVGLSTRAGIALVVGAAYAVLVALVAGAATLERRALRPALILALGLVAVPTASGHALDRGLSRVNVAADLLHVAGAAAWVGVLLGLVVVRGASARRAGALALAGLVLLAATGVVRASYELLRVSQLWHTPYGRALLVKTGILLAALAAGWLLRRRLRRRAGLELVLAAGLLVAVSFLVLERPGRNAVPTTPAVAPPAVSSSEPAPPPPPPPAEAVVVAHEVGRYGVALAAEPRRLTVLVLSPAGGGASGLDVAVDDRPASSCGQGCYRVSGPHATRIAVDVAGQRTSFSVPSAAPPAAALLARVRRTYEALSSVEYVERLASAPTGGITSRWRLEAPDRLTYAIRGGSDAVVIGAHRWDLDPGSTTWVESPQTPLSMPAPAWRKASNARLIAPGTISFVDRTIPAYFTVEFDPSTLRFRALHMTAAAHFMVDRFVRFNSPREIRPPTP